MKLIQCVVDVVQRYTEFFVEKINIKLTVY